MSLTTKTARKILGKQANSMSDPEVQSLVNQLYGLAEIIASMVSTSGSNKQQKVIDSPKERAQNGR